MVKIIKKKVCFLLHILRDFFKVFRVVQNKKQKTKQVQRRKDMPEGLQVWDEKGKLTVDTSDRQLEHFKTIMYSELQRVEGRLYYLQGLRAGRHFGFQVTGRPGEFAFNPRGIIGATQSYGVQVIVEKDDHFFLFCTDDIIDRGLGYSFYAFNIGGIRIA